MARTSDGTDVPVSPVPASSSNMGSPDGSLPDLEGTGCRAANCEVPATRVERIQIRKLRPDAPRQWPRMMRKSRILNKWLAALQPVLPTLETNATSVSSGSGSARSWNTLGHSDGSTAAGSFGYHGSGSSDDVGNTRRRLDTFSQAPKMNNHDVPSHYGSLANNTTKGLQSGSENLWEGYNLPVYNKLVRIHCKAGSVSVRLVFETRAKMSRLCCSI